MYRRLKALTLLLSLPLLLHHPYPLGAQVLTQVQNHDSPLVDAHFGEIWAWTGYESHPDPNGIGSIHFVDGFRVFTFNEIEGHLYGKLRFVKDIRGNHWDNKISIAPGFRIKPFKNYSLIFFAEYLFGSYQRQTNGSSGYQEWEAGAFFWHQWGDKPPTNRFFWPGTQWRELYTDAIFMGTEENDVIATLQLTEGIAYWKGDHLDGDLYLVGYGSVDTKRFYWNNWVEAGPGFRLNLDKLAKGLRLTVEGVAGTYIDRNSPYIRPYGSSYLDGRVVLSYRKNWKGKPWE